MKLLFIALFFDPLITTSAGMKTVDELINDVFKTKDIDISESNPLSFKDVDGRKGIATGYIANFNSLDSDGDVIIPGAFKKSLAENGPQSIKPRIKYILDHDWSKALGVFTTLQEDTKGLYYEAQIGTHAEGVDFIKKVDSGLITEHSFGYRTMKYTQVTPWMDYRSGDVGRHLQELKMYEGSPLQCWGANQNTPMNGVKKAFSDPDKLGKRIDLMIKALRTGTLTDDGFECLEIELKQLQQLYIDLLKKQPVEKENTTVEPPKDTLKKQRSFAKGSLIELLN